ncbi:hypothetical protein [Sphaerisporangium perillae]|uniref:hypothetical protein n=1 Tax=Sphaerisporangium perillae TaxID=2935860 RepID=UPI00200DEB69|nr:hypothetical protein [Sphaerisporangium perillae]
MGSRLIMLAATAVAMIVCLTGCGGSDFTYVMGSDGQSYFKVPASWQKVDQKALDKVIFGDMSSATAQARKQLSWTVGYDGFSKPSADHFLDAGESDEPFAFAMVMTLTETQRDSVSLDALRNMLLPVAVSADVREQLEASSPYPMTGFELLADEVLPPENGVRGVHVVYNFKVLGGSVQTFDQTAYLAADGTRVSVLLIRCSATCYQNRAGELDRIAQSFKVKRIPG